MKVKNQLKPVDENFKPELHLHERLIGHTAQLNSFVISMPDFMSGLKSLSL